MDLSAIDACIDFMLNSFMVDSKVAIMTAIFTGIITALTIVSAVVPFITKKRSKHIKKQLKNFDKYAELVTDKEKNRQIGDRNRAINNIYLKYGAAFNKIEEFNNMLESLVRVFEIGRIVACLIVLLALMAVHIWIVTGLLVFVAVTWFVWQLSDSLIKLLKNCKLKNIYPRPEDLLNPLNVLNPQFITMLNIDDDFMQNVFFYGLAIRAHDVDEIAKTKINSCEDSCKKYLSIYSFLPYSINEVTIICYYKNNISHKEKIHNFSEKTKFEKAIVNCLLHTLKQNNEDPITIGVCIESDNGVAITHEYSKFEAIGDGVYYPTGRTITESTCFASELDQGFASSERIVGGNYGYE